MKWLMCSGEKKKIAIQIKWRLQNWTRLCGNTHTAAERYDISGNAWFLFFCLACKKPPDGKMQKRRVSKKKKYDQLDFFSCFFLFFILPSAHLTVNETPSDLRGRSISQFFLSFSYSCYRWISSSSNLILRELKMYLQYLPMHHVCVCVGLSGGCSDGGSPSHVPAFRPKPGRFPPPKINVCESICAPVCVCVKVL